MNSHDSDPDLSPLTAGGVENDPDSGSPIPAGGEGTDSGASARSAGAQEEPLLDQNAASDADKVQGIVAQTRADVPSESAERIAEVLAQRFSDAGMTVADEEITRLAQGVAGG